MHHLWTLQDIQRPGKNEHKQEGISSSSSPRFETSPTLMTEDIIILELGPPVAVVKLGYPEWSPISVQFHQEWVKAWLANECLVLINPLFAMTPAGSWFSSHCVQIFLVLDKQQLEVISSLVQLSA